VTSTQSINTKEAHNFFFSDVQFIPKEVKFKLSVIYEWLPFKINQNILELVNQVDIKDLTPFIEKFGPENNHDYILQSKNILEKIEICSKQTNKRSGGKRMS
jgi:hypothetical protein